MVVNNETLTNLQDKIWLVIKSNSDNNLNENFLDYMSNFNYVLKKNDIIKLGRIKFLIRDLFIKEKSTEATKPIFKSYTECLY